MASVWEQTFVVKYAADDAHHAQTKGRDIHRLLKDHVDGIELVTKGAARETGYPVGLWSDLKEPLDKELIVDALRSERQRILGRGREMGEAAWDRVNTIDKLIRRFS